MFCNGGVEHQVLQAVLCGDGHDLADACQDVPGFEQVLVRLELGRFVHFAREGACTCVLLTLKGFSELATLNGVLPALAE
jgi:hypothetical protein